jgi:ribonuclease P protein component
MSNQYSRKLRLLTQLDFQKVYRNARRFPCYKAIILARINNQSHPRLGISLPKKVVTVAAKSSRIKRIIRENFRIRQNSLKGLDIIVIIKQSIDKVDPNFTMSLIEQWKKIALKS